MGNGIYFFKCTGVFIEGKYSQYVTDLVYGDIYPFGIWRSNSLVVKYKFKENMTKHIINDLNEISKNLKVDKQGIWRTNNKDRTISFPADVHEIWRVCWVRSNNDLS